MYVKKIFFSLGIFSCMLATQSCKQTATQETVQTADTTVTVPAEQEPKASIVKSDFGTFEDQPVDLYTLTNTHGITMKVSSYGGLITHLMVPDRSGTVEDVVLGYDSLSGYIKETPYFGALIGRYGNRIAKGKFKLEGKEYTLAVNNGVNHLHGGKAGFDKVIWNVEEMPTEDGVALKLTRVSKDMEEGYPGNLTTEVHYILGNNNALTIEYKATTDKPTIVNLTQHTYFNLSGNTKADILGQKLMLNASSFLPIDKTFIPTGELKPVKGTPFDFITPTAIGARVNNNDPQLKAGLGYDHCWILDTKGDITKPAVSLYDSTSGRMMEIFTTEPAMQFYCGNFLDGKITGKGNVVYKHRYGLCLEPEHYPDSPNKPAFPSVVLKPGETYQTKSIYKFTTN